MQMQILILAILTFTVNLYNVGYECNSKQIFDSSSKTLVEDTYLDVKKAFNGVASCISLISDDDSLCCYIKIKYKNRKADDKKFTHRGCIQLGYTELQDVKATTKAYEQALESDSENYKSVDVDIDCNSKFIKLTGLLLLAFLL